ncbi:hypothetical protein BY996DRAFT_3103511 [Phakopsora pachyrhizi]|nr:hypothetical protein BY996DRAFT_3103511 [Phakopsora pachyrhizi]
MTAINKLNLAIYAESNDDVDADADADADEDEGSSGQLKLERNKKRSEWAKGKTRAQPSENWDDDFLFGSASTESLPLPSKDHTSISSADADSHRQHHKKPVSSNSIQPLLNHSQSSRSVNHNPYSSRQATKPPPSALAYPKRSTKPNAREDSPPLLDKCLNQTLSPQESNSSTPRKRISKSSNVRNPPPPPINCCQSNHYPRASTEAEFTMACHPCLPSSRSPAIRCKAGVFRPPSSAPTSRDPSKEGLAPIYKEQRRVSDHDSPQPMTKENYHHGELRKHLIHSSRPPVSLARKPSTFHKAVSSQDSVPSISDISSNGFRSPSSSLSMTDESRGDWSRSSGDYSARFGERGSGNQSFSTETEFTEPETEIDWQDDTDFDNRSHCSVMIRTSTRGRGTTRISPRQLGAKLNSATSGVGPSVHRPFSHRAVLKPSNVSRPSQAFSPSIVSETEVLFSSSNSRSAVLGVKNSCHLRAPNSSVGSQSTFTSIQTSTSQISQSNLDQGRASAKSSTSSIGYYKSNHSDLSLSSAGSAAIGLSMEAKAFGKNYDTQGQSKASSNAAYPKELLIYQSGSESYDAATSGTETDCASERGRTTDRGNKCDAAAGIPYSSSTARGTPTAVQRSRKQALYSRPSYVNPSSSVSSLSKSMSSSTLSSSQISYEPKLLPDSQMLAGEDERQSRSSFLKKRLKKKKPSLLPLHLNSTEFNGASARLPTVSRKASFAGSLYAYSSPPSGDLAFAVDSEDDGQVQLKTRRRASRSTSPFEIVEKPDLAASAPINTPGRSGLPNRGVCIRSRSTILRASVSGATHSPAERNLPKITAEETAKKFKSRRPLSFTALLSRTPIGAICQPPCAAANSSNDPGTASTPSACSLDEKSGKKPRMKFGHRHAASIGSNPVVYPTDSTSVSTFAHPNFHESLISRMRRLSTRPSNVKRLTPPASPAKKQPSLKDCNRRTSLLSSPPTPSSENQGLLTSLNETLALVSASPTTQQELRCGLSESQSIASDLTLKASNQRTARGRKSSVRASNSPFTPPSDARGGSVNLMRKFTTKSSAKSYISQPNFSDSPDGSIDHSFSSAAFNNGLASSSSRRTFSSKPPKSNPALRRKSRLKCIQNDLYQAPSSEPIPDRDKVHNENCSDTNSLSSISCAISGPLARSNSMGELRIPSRITSQQGRLQAELNQVKEFARGVEELKSMRQTYQKIILATDRLNSQRESISDDSKFDLTDSDTPSDSQLTNLKQSTSTEISMIRDLNRVSPKALNKLYSTIHKIQEEYKEWWTCCNVLIDLGEGSTDPRTRFSPERLRAISCYSANQLKPASASSLASSIKQPVAAENGPSNNQKKHFEILKSMFGPGDGDSSSGQGSCAPRGTGKCLVDDSSDCQSLSEASQKHQTPPRSISPKFSQVVHTPSSWKEAFLLVP